MAKSTQAVDTAEATEAAPFHIQPARPVIPERDLVTTAITEEQLPQLPAGLQETARKALRDGHAVSVLGEGRAIRVDHGHE